MAATYLAQLAWPEVPPDSLLVVPLGSCEQHGPHLPVDTDQRIASWLSDQLAQLRPGLVIAPPVTIAASGEHQGFAGTLSIGSAVLESVIIELVRSALPSTGVGPFAAVLFVNGHGGNIAAVAAAITKLRLESRDAAVWNPQVAGGDSHAGRTETSILLHLDPACVRTERLEVGSTDRWRDIAPKVLTEGLAAITPNGVLGDPRDATAEEGARVCAELLFDLQGFVADWRGQRES
ncbi:MAG: mycofactocin biosynthesis peptidyl-dipeptidase MftE [Actinomycetes bacterium]